MFSRQREFVEDGVRSRKYWTPVAPREFRVGGALDFTSCGKYQRVDGWIVQTGSGVSWKPGHLVPVSVFKIPPGTEPEMRPKVSYGCWHLVYAFNPAGEILKHARCSNGNAGAPKVWRDFGDAFAYIDKYFPITDEWKAKDLQRRQELAAKKAEAMQRRLTLANMKAEAKIERLRKFANSKK